MAKTNQVRYEYTADGTQHDFAVPFDYLEDSDVQVLVDNVVLDIDAYSVQSSGTVQILAAPAAGSIVTVQRDTDARIPKNTFQAGSMLLPKPLDENFKQILYTVEEGVNTASDAVSLGNEAVARAKQAEDFAGQAALDAADAKQYAEAAEILADTAANSALQAAQQAGVAAGNASAALSTAGTAVDIANSASQTAVQASQNADYAVGVAEGIDQKAQDALDLSTNAIQRVEIVEGIVDDIAAGGVASFKGRTGVVVPEADDYDIQMITGLEAALQDKADASALTELTKVQVEDAGSDAFGVVSGRRLSEAVLKHSPPVAFGTTAGTAAEGNDPRLEGNVKTTGDQTIAGVKTYSSLPELPSLNPTTVNQAVRKGYVDTQIATRMPNSYLEQSLSNSAVKVPSSAAVSAALGNTAPHARVQTLATYGGTQKLTTPAVDWRALGVTFYVGDVFRITTPEGNKHPNLRHTLFTLEGMSHDSKTLTFNARQVTSHPRNKQRIEEFAGSIDLVFERMCIGPAAHPTLGRSLVDATIVMRQSTTPSVDYPVKGNGFTTRLNTRADQLFAWITGDNTTVHLDDTEVLTASSHNRHLTLTLPAGSELYFAGATNSSSIRDFWMYA